MPISHRPHRRAGRVLLAITVLALASCIQRPQGGSRNSAECLAGLDRLGVRYASLAPSRGTPLACRVDTPVEVVAATIPFSRPAVASCGFILAFDRFERETLRPLARRYFGQQLETIIHFGAYSCRTTRAGRESEHARGMAIDLAGFVLADGRRVMVKEDWSEPDTAGRFLHAVADEACRYFNEVLTPDSDKDHSDHLHLDLGPYKLCIRR